MNCQRCSGSMVPESFYGIENEYAWLYPGLRCLHCGEIVDTVIMANRMAARKMANRKALSPAERKAA
jgi:hypothetical protein